MFSPATRKTRLVPPEDRNLAHGQPDSSPSTPDAERGGFSPALGPRRPATGTPAPWASRLSVLARIPSINNSEKGSNADQIQPVYVGEVPQIVRKAQADCLQKKVAGSADFSGGMDKDTCLAWMISDSQIFIWSYLSSKLSNKCVAVSFPSSVLGHRMSNSRYGSNWMVCIVRWKTGTKADQECDSAGVIACHKQMQTVVYWSDIFSECACDPVVWFPNTEQPKLSSGSGYLASCDLLDSMIAAPVPSSSLEAVALSCHSSGKLLCFYCTPTEICQKEVSDVIRDFQSKGSVVSRMSKVYAKSLVWRFQGMEEDSRQFFLLVDHEIQCWNIIVSSDPKVTKLWSHVVVCSDGDSGIKKDLAGEKHIWLLDMQVNQWGNEFTILVATFCKDRINSSSYTEYSLLNMLYKPVQNVSVDNYSHDSVLEKKAPLQVIIPKAKVEDEGVLVSMRLRVGGKPSGSAVVLSCDGTATVTTYWKGSTRLYKFDLPYDAGKVLDVSVLPSSEDVEEGAWVVLTQKAGIWAIPEKAVTLGGVEPPERSLSRKGSLNRRLAIEEKSSKLGGIHASGGTSTIPMNDINRQQAILQSAGHRTAQDEESDVLLGYLFQDFLLSGEVNHAFEKLKNIGAFGKEGETNVFARMSKSIVDTLAKHWTATRGAEFIGSAVIVSQLSDKKQKHELFLQFMALSKCHEELSSKQRHSLQLIVEHGEKLFGMIQLRELQNMVSQNQKNESDPLSAQSFREAAGSLWDFIQLVGEKARRHTVLLMDRDNAEVFYSKVSDLEALFHCISDNLKHVVSEDQHFITQAHRAYEVSNACITLIHAARNYRDEHRIWYPSPEGLVTWNCQPVVRSGLWSIASLIMKLLKETPMVHLSVKSDLCAQLEELTDALLESYTSAVTAKSEKGEDHKSLVEEYHSKRDTLLDSLYHQAQYFAEDRYKEACKGTDDAKLKETIFREVSLPLLSIAKQHEGYKTLWNICYSIQDAGLLRSLMHESVGPMGGFSNFVFKQLHEKQQYSKLLRLGEEFQEELTRYLKQHKDLLWLHEVFLQNFSSAANTLHGLALSDNEGEFALVAEEESESERTEWEVSLTKRKRLLNLAKIAAMAGRFPGFEMEVSCIEANLQILMLQEEIVTQIPSSIEDKNASTILPPKELIEICLKGNTRELLLLAFEVFAWTNSSFRVANKGLLEECWRNAADQDDWLSLHQASLTEGWSDEVTAQLLGDTVLYKASNRCYGPEKAVFGGDFDQVLCLQRDATQLATWRGSISSVEEILMQHKDFPDAGKLMLTAVMMGRMASGRGKSGLLDMELR